VLFSNYFEDLLLLLSIRVSDLKGLSDDSTYDGRREMTREVAEVILEVGRLPRRPCVTVAQHALSVHVCRITRVNS